MYRLVGEVLDAIVPKVWDVVVLKLVAHASVYLS